MTSVTRDTVLLAGDDTDHDVGVELGLDSIPGDGMTVGDLVDEVNKARGDLSHLLCAMTGGAMSKPGWAEDTDAVIEAAAPVAMRAFAYNQPSVLDCEGFRKAVSDWFGPDVLKHMDADRSLPSRSGIYL